MELRDQVKGVIPVPERQPGDANTLKYAADQMRVNFFNTMTEAFEPRLSHASRHGLARTRNGLHASVKKAICRWGVQEPAEPYQEAASTELSASPNPRCRKIL
jgi:hypothetical protein